MEMAATKTHTWPIFRVRFTSFSSYSNGSQVGDPYFPQPNLMLTKIFRRALGTGSLRMCQSSTSKIYLNPLFNLRPRIQSLPGNVGVDNSCCGDLKPLSAVLEFPPTFRTVSQFLSGNVGRNTSCCVSCTTPHQILGWLQLSGEFLRGQVVRELEFRWLHSASLRKHGDPGIWHRM